MTALLKLEYIALFALSAFLFVLLPYAWWYPSLVLVPDIGMLGYAFGPRIGARIYNLFHLLFVGVGLYFVGVYAHLPLIELAGVIMIGHSSLDRVLGFGLKHEGSFKHKQLGLP